MKYILAFLLIQSLVACQQVEVNKNEVGVYFKRFGGGVDTSKIIKPGKYSIPNWDYITTYQIAASEGEFVYSKTPEKKYIIQYTFQLDKEKVALYHNFIGGNPTNYAERGIKEHLDKQSAIEIQEFVVQDSQNQLMKYKKAVENYYIKLVDLKIADVEKE